LAILKIYKLKITKTCGLKITLASIKIIRYLERPLHQKRLKLDPEVSSCLRIGSFNLHGLKGREEFANSLSFDLDVLLFCESFSNSLLKTNSYFNVPNRLLYSRNAKCEKKNARPAGFIVNESLKGKANTSLNDWMAIMTIGNLKIIGVYLTHEAHKIGDEILASELISLEVEQSRSTNQ